FIALKSIENENEGNKYDAFFKSNTKVELRFPEEVSTFFNALSHTSPYRERRKVQDDRSQVITGEPDIDEQLNEVINFLFRDYVHSWYKHVSPNNEFIEELRAMIVDVIRNVAQRSRNMDKVSYVTTKLVDDFASHLRLYRLAENRLKLLKIEDPNANLLSIFFDLELQMEQNHLCRDYFISLEYLTHICDILQYLLLPPECFNNRPIRVFIRTLLVNSVFCPILDLLSDPDFINRTLVWFFKSKLMHTVSPETFLLVIRCCDNADELNAVLEMVNHEIAVHQSQDTGGDDDFDIKQQLNGLLYVQKVIRSRLKCLTSGDVLEDNNELSSIIDLKKFAASGAKLFQIPFDVVLKNNVALSYFIEYMSSVGAQGYVYFFLNVEGFRISAEQQLSEEALSGCNKISSQNCDFNLNSLKEAASNIYDTYLSLEKTNSHKLINDENVIKIVAEKIKTGKLSETWFDEAHQKVFETMRDDEKFFPSFKKSIHYIKLLAELDLLKDVANNNNSCSVSQKSNDDGDSGSIKSSGSFDSDSIHSFEQADDCLTIDSTDSDNFINNNHDIVAEITHTGIVREFGNPYGVYCITVNRKDVTNPNESKWCVLRRYSDFYTFHQSTLEKFAPLRNLALPGKRPFNNMSKEFLEQRRHLLNSYLQQVLRRLGPQSPSGLKEHILHFLQPGNYEKEKTSVKISKTMNTIVNPFKTSVKTVGNVIKASSDNIKDGIHKLSKLGSMGSTSAPTSASAKSKTLNSTLVSSSSQPNFLPPLINNSKVGKALDVETEDNIPLRIMLLLMDEVFDLKSKNMWLRRRIVAVVRQIIAATFGDKINRKIVDYVQELVNSAAITEYIRSFKNYFWPNGGRMQQKQERSFSTKMRTRIAAKMLLLSHLSDDFKHVIGSETTRKGLLCVFQMLQIEQLNRRLVFVLLEGFLQTLFPENYFPEIFERLHSSSARLKGKNQRKTKWPPYLSKFNGTATVSSSFSSPSSSGKSSPLNRPKYS
ncbi:sorting nexin-like protein, partial [Leptotrombidium deliense]